MKGFLIGLILSLFASSAVAETKYHVNQNGSDTLCSGLVDADYAGNPNCGFATPTKALATINCAAGDDIFIHAGNYTGSFIIPKSCQAPSQWANAVVIEGDIDNPVAASLIGNGTVTLFSEGGAGSTAARSKFVTVQYLRLVAGTKYGIQLNGTHEGIRLWKVTIDVPTVCCATGAAAAAIYVGPNQGCWGCHIQKNTITGLGTTTKYGITGSDAQALNYTPLNSCSTCTIPKTSYITGNKMLNMLGSFFGGNYSDSIVENNFGSGTVSMGDDGGMQLYNSRNFAVRFNLFINVKADEATNYGAFFVLRSTTGDSTKFVDGDIYNNTIIGSYITTSPNVGKKYFYMGPSININGGLVRFANNLILTNFGVDLSTYGASAGFPDKFAAAIDDCSTAGIYFGNNLINNIGWRDNGQAIPFNDLWIKVNQANCPIDVSTMFNKVGVDPQLNYQYVPSHALSEACDSGIIFPAALDGQPSRSYIGYARGACDGLEGGPLWF